MRNKDWSSDVFSSDLQRRIAAQLRPYRYPCPRLGGRLRAEAHPRSRTATGPKPDRALPSSASSARVNLWGFGWSAGEGIPPANATPALSFHQFEHDQSEEHTSELQSLMRNSYDVFCLKKKKK